jgi:hypothetical protein
VEDAPVIGELGVEDVEQLASIAELFDGDGVEIRRERWLEGSVEASALLWHGR